MQSSTAKDGHAVTCYHMQAGLKQASDKLAAAQQLLQEIESSSGAQELQLTQQLSSQTHQLTSARQASTEYT